MKNISKRLKYVFPVLILILVAGLILSRIYQPDSSPPKPEISINAAEAGDYIGTAAEVCGEVASANYLQQIGGEPTFINLGRDHPDQLFTVVIWGEYRAKWKTPPEYQYLDSKICVSGLIKMHKGIPQIIVNSPNQIEIE